MTETAEKLKLELSQLSLQDRAELAYFENRYIFCFTLWMKRLRVMSKMLGMMN